MRALRIVVMTADAERLRGALMLAAAQAALGGDASIFLQLEAVALLRTPVAGPHDAQHKAAGLPDLAALMTEAMGLGVAIKVCQSGMTLTGLSVDDLADGIDIGGPVSFLQQTGDEARLIVA